MKISDSTLPADLVKRLLPVLVPLAVLAAFWPTLRADFVNWDDDANFLNNPHFRGLDWPNLRWMFTTLHMGNYQPLSWLALMYLGQTAEALAHFQKAVDLVPEYVVAHNNLGAPCSPWAGSRRPSRSTGRPWSCGRTTRPRRRCCASPRHSDRSERRGRWAPSTGCSPT